MKAISTRSNNIRTLNAKTSALFTLSSLSHLPSNPNHPCRQTPFSSAFPLHIHFDHCPWHTSAVQVLTDVLHNGVSDWIFSLFVEFVETMMSHCFTKFKLLHVDLSRHQPCNVGTTDSRDGRSMTTVSSSPLASQHHVSITYLPVLPARLLREELAGLFIGS